MTGRMFSPTPTHATLFDCMRTAALSVRPLIGVVAIGVLFAPRAATAENRTDAALAESLFREGKDLMAKSAFAEACPKLAESQRIAPGMGTLLSLAICHEGENRLALAWAEYSQVLPSARRAGRQDRADYAEQRIKALEPRLSRLTIEVSSEAKRVGVEVKVNDLALSEAALGVAAPMDGGRHKITASAPGYQIWSADIEIKPEGENARVSIPALAPVTAPAQPALSGAPAAHPIAADTVPRTSRPITTPIYVSGGVAVAFAATSIVTGIVATRRASDFTDKNHDPSATQAERQSARDSASSMGLVSTVLAGGAVIAASVTGYLYLTRPARTESGGAVRVVPWAAPGGAGVAVGGSW
jgi:hypothetical protein